MGDRVGLVQVYTGDGKGKTTAAIGQAVRAAGRGLRCHIIQFMKAEVVSGEMTALKEIKNVSLERFGLNFVGPKTRSRDEVVSSLQAGLAAAEEAVGGSYDLVVLDELVIVGSLGLVSEQEIVRIIKGKDVKVEIILTGRGAGPDLISLADLVTEMRAIKHPFAHGQAARAGIEF